MTSLVRILAPCAISLLEAGYTTVLSGGGPGNGGTALRAHIKSGMINGPRVIPSERINLRGTPEEPRVAIRAMAAKGIIATQESQTFGWRRAPFAARPAGPDYNDWRRSVYREVKSGSKGN
jgi:hypothetical protein